MNNQFAFLNDRILLNEQAALHYTDLSIQRGIGIFDFLAVVDFEPVFIDLHLARLEASAKEMRLPLSYSNEELKMIINELIRKNELSNGGIRITVTGGYSPDGYNIKEPNLIIATHSFRLPSADQFQKGIKLITWQHQRQMPQVKTIDYLMAVWLQPHLQENGADDVLYFNRNSITECPRANIFMVTHDNKIITPAHSILPGITRQQILAFDLGYEFELRNITRSELLAAKEVFITSTTKRILPVNQVDEQQYISPGPITIRLAEKLKSLIQHSFAE